MCMAGTKYKPVMFCLEQSRLPEILADDILDVIVDSEMGKKTEQYWILQLLRQYPDPIDERTANFNTFINIARSKGYTDLMIIKK